MIKQEHILTTSKSLNDTGLSLQYSHHNTEHKSSMSHTVASQTVD